MSFRLERLSAERRWKHASPSGTSDQLAINDRRMRCQHNPGGIAISPGLHSRPSMFLSHSRSPRFMKSKHPGMEGNLPGGRRPVANLSILVGLPQRPSPCLWAGSSKSRIQRTGARYECASTIADSSCPAAASTFRSAPYGKSASVTREWRLQKLPQLKFRPTRRSTAAAGNYREARRDDVIVGHFPPEGRLQDK